MVSYDPATATCTSYCHGSGARLSTDAAPGLNHTPVFNGGPGQAACGTCHGIPPKRPGTTYHNSTTSITQCSGCHPKTVTSAGNIIINADGSSFHVNGVVDRF